MLISTKGSSRTQKYKNFAGGIIYGKGFNTLKYNPYFIDPGPINGVSELFINDNQIGVEWYGQHVYKITNYLKEGNNRLKILVSTMPVNYCKSFQDNVTCQRWTAHSLFTPVR